MAWGKHIIIRAERQDEEYENVEWVSLLVVRHDAAPKSNKDRCNHESCSSCDKEGKEEQQPLTAVIGGYTDAAGLVFQGGFPPVLGVVQFSVCSCM